MKNEISQTSTANLVWVATALLHTEHKEKDAFQSTEIFERAKSLKLSNVADDTILMHISLHCVANSKPQPNTHRKLFRVVKGWFRLYRPGDSFNEDRKNGRAAPLSEELPPKYHWLVEWYHNEYCKKLIDESKESVGIASNAVFEKIEINKTLKLPDDVCDFLQVDSGDYVAFVMNTKGEVILKKAKMKLEV